MRYGSVCSGIEAASVAWEPLGWEAAWFSEIDPFCNTVLSHHWPETTNLGDMTAPDFVEAAKRLGPIDLLVGGTPCQAFSTAGNRKGFSDDRGNLTLRFLEIAGELRPPYLLWENVPGVLTQDGGRTFGTVLGKVAELGYRWAYRILDSQHFGIPQRRRRVYLVGCLGDRCPGKVLFEQEGEGRHLEESREKGEEAAGTAGNCPQGMTVYSFYHHSGLDQKFQEDVAPPLTVGSGKSGQGPAVAYSIFCQYSGAKTNHAIEITTSKALGTSGLNPDCQQGGVVILQPITGTGNTIYPTLRSGNNRNNSRPISEADMLILQPTTGAGNTVYPCLRSGNVYNNSDPGMDADMVILERGGTHYIVRRLTPRECERLQGFPDDHTLITYRKKSAPDGQRYRATGNSMATPVMFWIGRRLQDFARAT